LNIKHTVGVWLGDLVGDWLGEVDGDLVGRFWEIKYMLVHCVIIGKLVILDRRLRCIAYRWILRGLFSGTSSRPDRWGSLRGDRE